MDYRNYNRGYAEPAMSASDYMTRTYRWMASGLLITFAMAYITATTPLLYLVDSLYLVLTIADKGAVLNAGENAIQRIGPLILQTAQHVVGSQRLLILHIASGYTNTGVTPMANLLPFWLR